MPCLNFLQPVLVSVKQSDHFQFRVEFRDLVFYAAVVHIKGLTALVIGETRKERRAAHGRLP